MRRIFSLHCHTAAITVAAGQSYWMSNRTIPTNVRDERQELEMIHFQRTRMIDASPEAVWSVLGRFMHIDEFAPQITSVDALTEGEDGLGSKRRNHFQNGTSLVEEVVEWKPNEGYTVNLSDMAALPLREANSEVSIVSMDGRSKVIWSFDYRVKYGPLGWLMGQTMMKMMMGKIIDANLQGLADKVAPN
ncbi:MAG: SRPBCC family protein [Rhizobiaceae bacterium]